MAMALVLVTVFFSVAATALGAVLFPFSDMKIIGGTTAHIDGARFMVQVITIGTNGSMEVCGGTLISTTHVLTAAHCVPSPKDVGNVRVFAGTSEFLAQGKNGRIVHAKALRAHPKFKIVHEGDEEYAVFDVAVIRLKEAVLPSAKTAIISLTKAGFEPKAGASMQVAGWGVYKGQNLSRKLRIVTLKVRTRAQCLKDFGVAFRKQEICTSSSSKAAFCNGDSGGPAYIGNVQYGVVSWGSCGEGPKPAASVFANLADPQINSFVNTMIRTL